MALLPRAKVVLSAGLMMVSDGLGLDLHVIARYWLVSFSWCHENGVPLQRNMNNDSFQIREYGRTELAQLYSPDITSQAAWRKLKEWIERNSSLYDELCALGYDGSKRTFTPRMVSRIVYYLGRP